MVDRSSELVAKAAIWLVMPLVVILCWEIVMRGVFDIPTNWAHESTQYFFGAYFLLGGAYALRVGNFINVDILVAKMSDRKRAAIDASTGIVALAFIVAFIWKGFELLVYSIQIGERSSTAWSPPVWPIKLALVAGSLLLGGQLLANYVRSLVLAVTGRNP
jgi:TRAP-type mannitol/chloroaromatic compound transport system permease small subunit